MATDRLDLPAYRVPRSEGLDGGTKRLALTALGLGGTLMLVLGFSSATGHRHGDIPVIRAESGPYRVKPADPGGMQVNGADDDFVGSSNGSSASDKLAPPPETPTPSALHMQQPAAAAGAPAGVPASAAPGVPASDADATQPTSASAATPPAAMAPPPAPAPAKPAAAAPAAAKPAMATPAPAAGALPAKLAPVPAVAAPAPAAGALPAKAAPVPVSPRAAGEPAGKTEVQLGALSSEADAQKEWARLARKAPELLGARRPLVTRFDRDGRTFWRVRTGGFGDVAEATRFCEQARAKGVACSIPAF